MSNINVEVTKKSTMNVYKQVQAMNIKRELSARASRTLSRARVLVPVDTGTLKNDGRVEKIDDGYSVIFGDAKVPYARRRHYENKKNPQTKHYLERAGDSVKKEGFIIMKGEK